MMMIRFFLIFFFFDIALLQISLLFWEEAVVYSLQIAFISSALIMMASIKSYEKMVKARLSFEVGEDNLKKIEDPYELYDEEDEKEPKIAKRSLKEVAKDSKTAFSFYRIGAYLLLFLGFLYLRNNNFLDIQAYLISLSFAPILTVIYLGISLNEN